jgi:crossover junction endodeoxyribonuclease RuvC
MFVPKLVLGIDPGLSRCGYGAVRVEGSMSTAVAAGILTTPTYVSLPERLAQLHGDLESLLDELEPHIVAVERVFFQTNVRTAMSVGQASGLALALAQQAGCEVVQYTPTEVKMCITGYGAATKEQMQRMVQTQLHLETLPEPPDAADALALALCHASFINRNARLAKVGA